MHRGWVVHTDFLNPIHTCSMASLEQEKEHKRMNQESNFGVSFFFPNQNKAIILTISMTDPSPADQKVAVTASGSPSG